ncbi:MAG: SBBP repeat-containing protein [Armatimonadetes bacterium]|nr:SBBP repeat-containing protein [Armatimonadota bacterium]
MTVAIGAASAALGQVQEQWVTRYNGPGNAGDGTYAIAVDDGGNVYVTGYSFGLDTRTDYATIKYDSSGNQLWEMRYNGPIDGNDTAVAIALDSSGNVYVTGTSEVEQTPMVTGRDYATIKYDTDGNQLWVRHYDNGSDFATAIAVDDAGNVYVTGRSSGTGFDYLTVKYDTDGNQLWEARYDGPVIGSSNDHATAIVLDSAGNVYVTGNSEGIGSGFDYATIKYDTNGNELWVRRFNGPANIFDGALDLALDDGGNVYVTGFSLGQDTDADYVTLKYDPDGQQLWEMRYNGPGNGRDNASALVVDGAGNVYVTGLSDGPGTAWDYATLKYDTNGNLLWERRYNGPASSIDGATQLALDNAGNLYVTGWSFGNSTGRDNATVKYDSSGNQLWVMRYNGPGSGWDTAFALAVDDPGNVYVTGYSLGLGTGVDYATIKYVQDVEVLPDSFSLFRGMLIGGGLSDLLASDDSWMTVLPGITLNQAERPVQLIIEGTAPTETPSELRFRVEAHAEINNIGQWIELWNYDTSSYEEVDFMIATTVDSIVEVSITTNPERFIQAGTKEMKAKVSYKEAGIVLFFPWLISFDQTAWVIVP